MLAGRCSQALSVKWVHPSLAQLCGFHVHRKRFSLVPLLTICPLRPRLSLPFPILTNCEHQVFQPIWQHVFPFWTRAGDIKCLLHALTDVLLHSSHAPVTSLGKGSSPPSCPQGEVQTDSGHCPQIPPVASIWSSACLASPAGVLSLCKNSRLQRVRQPVGSWCWLWRALEKSLGYMIKNRFEIFTWREK